LVNSAPFQERARFTDLLIPAHDDLWMRARYTDEIAHVYGVAHATATVSVNAARELPDAAGNNSGLRICKLCLLLFATDRFLRSSK
jgi:hypothetical protein